MNDKQNNQRFTILVSAILLVVATLSSAGVFFLLNERAVMQDRFSVYTEHIMEKAFHLHTTSLRIAELSTIDFTSHDPDAFRTVLSEFRVTLSAYFRDYQSKSLEEFKEALGGDHPIVVSELLENSFQFESNTEMLLAELSSLNREADPAVSSAALEERLTPYIRGALQAAQRMHTGIRRAEAIAFVELRREILGLNWTTTKIILILIVASIGSIVTLIVATHEARKREAELRLSNIRLIEAQKAEKEFLANISHEIRTPVNGILGIIRLLENATGDEERDDLSHRLRTSANDLSQLVTSVLDAREIENGNLYTAPVWCEIRDVISGFVETYHEKAREKGLTFTVEDLTAGTLLFVDPDRLSQIVSALLSNGVKFTDSGFVRVVFQLDDADLTISVEDSGVGIPPEMYERIFDRFFQGDRGYTKRHRGLGLGLWVVRQICSLLGGDLSFLSRPEGGTVFTARIPVERKSVVVNPVEAVDQILVAEDDAINRLYLVKLLKKYGYSVYETRDGQEAVDAVEKYTFPVAILDIAMPRKTGIDVARHIRKRESNRERARTGLIALTGHSRTEIEVDCMDAGFDVFVNKPFSEGVLLGLVRQLNPAE